MANQYSRAKFIDDLVSTGAFTYEEAKKHADEHERGAATKVEKPESAAISEPTAAEVQAGLKDMTTQRAEQEGMTTGEKIGYGLAAAVPVATGLYQLGKKSGIKERRIGEGAKSGEGIRIEPQMDVNQQGPKEPTFAPETPATSKAASLAQQFEAEYGFPLSEVEKHYQMPIKDMQEARLLGGAYKANIAPATPAGVIPSTTNMTTASPIGVAPPAVMPEPIISVAPTPAAPAPAPIVEAPVLAATESDVPTTQTAKPSKGVAPEGMRPQYEKGKKNPIGPGGYNWIYGQEGERAPAVWENLFGKKNVPYEEARNKFMEFQLSGQEPGRGLNELPKGELGGANKKPKYIPEYIKGGATMGGASAAGGAAIGALLAKPSIEGAIQSIKEGDAGMTASYLSNLLDLHPVGAIANALFGLSPQELQTLRNSKQAQKVGAGRGIAPPSAYQR